jgi:hypothetical protein
MKLNIVPGDDDFTIVITSISQENLPEVLARLFDHSEKMRSDERWTVKECIAFRRSRIFICLFNPPAAELYRKAFWGTSDGER